ncbi:MAG: PEGA domain-containing protein [Pseudomonadota bacterium]
MKICPHCQNSFDDDVGRCPDDGELLVLAGEPNNPRSRGVVPVDESAETCMLDVESLREELGDDLPPPEELGATLSDASSTKLLSKEEVQSALKETKAHYDRGRIGADGQTQQVRRDSATPVAAGNRGLLAALIALGGLLVLLAAVLTVVLWPEPTQLAVTTAPSGARVEIDGVINGDTPLVLAMEPGRHTVSLSLEGYNPVSQIIDVPKGGRQLTVALVKPEPAADPQPDDSEATLKARADAIFQEVEALLDVGNFDAADSRLQVLAVMVPGDERVADAMKRVTDTRDKAAKDKAASRNAASNKPGDPAPEALGQRDREQLADKLFKEGQALYKKNDLAGARESLLKAIRYDPRFYPPHRVLARIYNRENNVQKTKYHLTRYIELGGADEDYKIRQWLATH